MTLEEGQKVCACFFSKNCKKVSRTRFTGHSVEASEARAAILAVCRLDATSSGGADVIRSRLEEEEEEEGDVGEVGAEEEEEEEENE